MTSPDKPGGRRAGDGGTSASWRLRQRPRADSRRPPADACKVTPADLERLDRIHELLRALNDACAGGGKVAEIVGEVPVLAARCLRRATRQAPAGVKVKSLEHALVLVGNGGLESELLTLLEDLTCCKADLEDSQRDDARKTNG